MATHTSLWTKAAPVLRTPTGFGWAVLAAGVLCWILAAILGWVELLILATACLLLFLLCCLFTIGRAVLKVSIILEPRRISAGEDAAGQVTVTNLSRTRLLPAALELPVRDGVARFDLPSLAADAQHREIFIIPPARRGIIPVGPATTVRGDPLGLLRRAVTWTEVIELFVRPVVVPLAPVGSGLLRDLEGQATDAISNSDLAFHALREYAPGDDRRHIHWRSSAKMSAATPDGKFFVRQYRDTRRSHLAVVVDGTVGAYGDVDEFEIAASVGASAVTQALRDNVPATVLIAAQTSRSANGPTTLDAFSRAELGISPSLYDLTTSAAQSAADVSIALIISGSNATFAELKRAAGNFRTEVRRVLIQVNPASAAGLSNIGSLTVVQLPRLDALPALLKGAFPQ